MTRAPSAGSPVVAVVPVAARRLCLNVPAGLAAGNPVALANCTGLDSESWSATDLQSVINTITAPDSSVLEVAASAGAGSAAFDGRFQHLLSQ